MIAREFVDQICVVNKVVPNPAKPGTFLHLDEIDTALRDEFVDTLLSEAKLPAVPTTLGAFITKYRKQPQPVEVSRAPGVQQESPRSRLQIVQELSKLELPPARF